MIGLFIITLSFVLYRRKVLLILHSLFSTRYLQQLLREGKLANASIYLYSMLLYFFAFPCLIMSFIQFYPFSFLQTFSLSSWQLFGIIFCILTVLQLISHFILQFFTSIFNYQEQKYLYTTIKALFRFYHALILIFIIPVIYYARVPQFIFFGYIPIFIILFFTFFIRFIRNINGVSRIHFFIYFCSLEILPYLLTAKLLIINF
jgi:hypothetical protein